MSKLGLPMDKLDKIYPYLVDSAIIAIFALAPGIRGYQNWDWWEYAFLAMALVYILYKRHS
jgi:hypothetical protein